MNLLGAYSNIGKEICDFFDYKGKEMMILDSRDLYWTKHGEGENSHIEYSSQKDGPWWSTEKGRIYEREDYVMICNEDFGKFLQIFNKNKQI